MNRQRVVLSLLLLLSTAWPLVAQKRPIALSELERAKLHPTFQEMLRAVRNATSSSNKFPEAFNLLWREATIHTGRVHAVVWTENAALLRAKGLHINSDFGKFVTVMATPEELEML
ncbi:MAG: hypothetical protein RMI34_05665, partial [Chloroherpetonaceae bacterium]|nr:hypothetical protein [Chloroherpetonaceae bacterium]MDW8019546.1 hypothetical protein [Chloroherpetonaceae bacterium]